MGSEIEEQASKRTIPRADRMHQLSVTTSSQSVEYADLSNIDTSQIVYMEAAGGDVYVVCGAAGLTIVASTGAYTEGVQIPGKIIPDGQSEEWWIGGGTELYYIGSASCKLNIYQATDR